MRGLGGGPKWGTCGAMFTTANSFLLFGVLTSMSILLQKSIKKYERESARRRTHAQRQTGCTIICPLLYPIAMGHGAGFSTAI